MSQTKTVWVFHGRRARFAGGVFSEVVEAERWIATHALTGTLTAYPLDEGVYDWAIRNDVTGMKREKFEERSEDPDWVGGFTSAAQEHIHFEDGKRA